MRVRLTALLLFCCLALSPLAAADGRLPVYYRGEVEMFADDVDKLDLYVAPLMGADSMCLVCGGEAMMVDTGKNTDYRAIKALLDHLDLDEFKYVYISHPHSDHIGGFQQLIADFDVGAMITVFPENYVGDNTFQIGNVKAAKNAGIEVILMESGGSFTLGGAVLTVYRQTRLRDENAMSGVLLVTFGEARLLLYADCFGVAAQNLALENNLYADVLKFPHHGVGANYDAFIEQINPSFAIFSHSMMDTTKNQALVLRHQIPFGFATWGVIHASTDGTQWVIRQWLGEEGQRLMDTYGGKNGIRE